MTLPSPKSIQENAQTLLRGWRSALRLLSADHQTIYKRQSRVDGPGGDKFRLHVALAPSRRLRKPRLPDMSEAGRFAEAAFDEPFAVQFASNSLVKLAAAEDCRFPSTITLFPNALIEAVWNIPHSTNGGDAIVLNASDVLRPLNCMARKVRDGSYADLFSCWRHRRIDWFVNLSATISGETGLQHWSQMRFPGREPRLQTNQKPFAPVEGLVPEQLRGLSPRAGLEELESVVLRGLLEFNGYGGAEVAVADVLETMRDPTHHTG